MTSPSPTKHDTSTAAVRQQFIDFFVQRAHHTFVPSSPVVPHDDPTLLFTNAGMNQFKPLFLGQVDPNSPLAGLKRAVNSQKCIRAGGKHNDLDDVGKDLYHHTFFEMLGNWSFGDYFKAEAIQWAWELLTDIWGLDKERLYATYFEGADGVEPDLEAKQLWERYLPPERVLPGNMKDNFWEMGDTGPCGPCSEIHYDDRPADERAKSRGRKHVNNHPAVLEIWNLVFIQFDRQASGLKSLPAKHVDTGMGLERITRILNGVQSNYDTDAFTPLFAAIQRVTGAPAYTGKLEDQKDIAYRVIADHVRTLSFAIADGAVPSNDGRGYVLRRILRRAVRYGRQTLGVDRAFMGALVPTLVQQMGHAYPELKKHEKQIVDVLTDEEVSFGRTLESGILRFETAAIESFGRAYAASSGVKWISAEGGDFPDPDTFGKVVVEDKSGQRLSLSLRHDFSVQARDSGLGQLSISATDAFTLHDTYGFPIDLTQQMAAERGMTVDVAGFERLMEEARERSRGGGGTADPIAAVALTTEAVAKLPRIGAKPTKDGAKFAGKPVNATVKAIWNGHDFDESVNAHRETFEQRIAVVLDKTCFYAEMGGQVADTGHLHVSRESGLGRAGGGEFEVELVKAAGGYVAHIGRVRKGEIRVGDVVEVDIDTHKRIATASNHTSTHLLNWALREVLGDGIDQKGSLVEPARLRFDFSHNKGLSEQEIERIEQLVGERIAKDWPVDAQETALVEAKKIAGVRAVFGEVYPDPVRVVAIGETVANIMKSPEDAKWRAYSIEFCGGTHLERTGAATSFVITSEGGISKGIRRIEALTGDAAAKAHEAGKQLLARAKGAAPTDAGAIEQDMESRELALRDKIAIRAALDQLRDKAKAAQKAAAAESRGGAVEAARAIADANDGEVIVAEVPGVGAERDALLAAMDVLKSKRPESAVMLFGADASEGKVTIVARVPDALIKRGLKAGDWV
ncbi:MAG: alanine--tRNA ligase, partial [Phycisphaerales bacterium]|nr:alanine--tRNA ligase [Phycisphaerales bacterium]